MLIFFTKPLQGAAFKKFRDQIMNIQEHRGIDNVHDPRSVLEHDNKDIKDEQMTDGWTMVQPRKMTRKSPVSWKDTVTRVE